MKTETGKKGVEMKKVAMVLAMVVAFAMLAGCGVQGAAVKSVGSNAKADSLYHHNQMMNLLHDANVIAR